MYWHLLSVVALALLTGVICSIFFFFLVKEHQVSKVSSKLEV